MANARKAKVPAAWLRLLVIGALVASPAAAGDAAMSKAQLLALIEGKVDPGLVTQLVQKNCVSFELTPEVILELSPVVPREVLSAAIACKGSAPAAPSEDDEPETTGSETTAAAPFELSDIRDLAVVPATFDGDPDDPLTFALLQELRIQRPRYRIIDPLDMEEEFDYEDEFHAEAPLRSLLEAARSHGAQAVLLVTGTSFRRLEDPGVNLDARMVETRAGKVVWKGGGSGRSDFFSWLGAMKNAASRTVSTLP